MQVYLIPVDEKGFELDVSIVKAIADIHRQDRLDAVFLNNQGPYPILRRYCSQNHTSPIEFVDNSDRLKADDFFIDLWVYRRDHPNALRVANIGTPSDLETISQMLTDLKIETKRVDL